MAYIPPHKRNSSNDPSRPPLKPEVLNPTKPHQPRVPSLVKSGDIVYAQDSIHKLLISDNKQVPSPLFLKPLSSESVEPRLRGNDVRVLVKSNPSKDNNEAESVAVAVWPDLLSSVEILRIKKDNIDLVARIGNNIFHGGPNKALEDEVDEPTLREMRKMFNTDLTTCSSYINNVISNVVSKIGAVFAEEKRTYYIKLSDRAYPKLVLLCKCRSSEDRKLHLYKVERIPIRQMVIDIACINKNLDLRIALCSKKISTDYTEDEMQGIRDIVDSAIIDSEVKGGLRWPFGRASSGDRFTVVGGTFKVTKIYNSPLLKIKKRHANRFEFRSSTGDSAVELDLKFNGLVSSLQEEKVDEESNLDMFKGMLRMIWDHFL